MPLENKNRVNVVLLVLAFILIACAYTVKIYSPILIERLYDAKQFGVINTLASAKGEHVLDFYQGDINNNYSGPFFILAAGFGFLIICYVFFKNSSAKAFFIPVFLYLLFTKYDVLFNPPYGDAIGGPFVEALWLFHHKFNYISLAAQPAYDAGGPKVYLFSIYPTYIASLMSIISNTKIFLLINHLLVFVMGAISIALFREIFRTFVDDDIALFGSLAFLSLPLFQAQVEALNMEMPSSVFVMASVYFLVKKKISRSGLMAIIAIMIKYVTIYVGATVFFVSIFLFFFDEKLKGKWKVLFGGLVPLSFIFFIVFLVFSFLKVEGGIDWFGPFEGWHWMHRTPIFRIYYISLALFVLYFIIQRFFFKKEKKRSLGQFFNDHYVVFIMFVCAGGWFAFFVNSFAGIPRYTLVVMPIIVFIVFYIFRLFLRFKPVIIFGLILSIFAGFLCSYGLFYDQRSKRSFLTDHIFLERSLEYRNSLELFKDIAKEIDQNYSNYTIGAPHILAQFLAFPELGAVKNKLDVMIFDFPCKYDGLRTFEGLKKIDVSKTVWVEFKRNLPEKFEFSDTYPLTKYDKLIKKMVYGDRYAFLFQGGAAIETMRLYERIVLIWLAEKRKRGMNK